MSSNHHFCVVNEAESIRFAGSTALKNPGPGYYDPVVEKVGAHHKVSSTEGTFPRGGRSGLPTTCSPGPKYYPSNFSVGVGPKTAMGSANRFPAIQSTPDFCQPLERSCSPTSIAGTLPQASRNSPATGSPRGPVSPGPKYNTRRSLVFGNRRSFLAKADRFPPPDERSPGPVYLPKTSIGPSPGPRFSRERRDRTFYNPDAEANPGPAAYRLPPGTTPAHSFGIKPKLWSKVLSDAPGCTHYMVKDSSARALSPAFSFAAPDPEVLALFKQQRGATLRTSVKSERDKSGKRKSKDGNQASGEGQSGEKGGDEDTKEASKLATAATAASRFPSRNTFTITLGMESPGPAHYMNIYKLFDSKPGPKSFVFNSRREIPPKKAPGPLTYCPEKYDPKYDKPGSPTFTRATRVTFENSQSSPGPVYNNDKWPKKTPIRHGVATQTPNYSAKAESRAKAERESKAKTQLKHQLAVLQNDTLPCDDQFFQYAPAAGVEDVPARKDKFLVNVWY